jgi:3-oxo-5-alpha-steroid 4-dehydrogenase 3
MHDATGTLYKQILTLEGVDLLPPFYVLLSLTAISSRAISSLATLASHGKTWKKSSNWWWIPKRYFLHFYVIGLASLLAMTTVYKDSDDHLSLAQALLFLHLLRRVYECCYVHQSRPTSQMHMGGYCLGMGHYLVLPLVFAGRSQPNRVSSPLSLAIGLANLWFQYEQYKHHVILGQLRGNGVSSALYPLPPKKRWFRYILCPHYLAEMLLYLSWALLLQPDDTIDVPISTTAGLENLLQHASHYRHWFLFLWVTTNLTVASRNNYDWYKSRFPKLSQAALIPYIF